MRVAIIALMLTVATQAEAECDNLCVLRKDRCKAAAAILLAVGLVAGVGVAATITACKKTMLHLRAHSFSVNPKLMTKLSTIPNHQLSISCGVCKHHVLLEIANRIAVMGDDTTAHEARQKAGSHYSGVKGDNTWKTVYAGKSALAMSGAFNQFSFEH